MICIWVKYCPTATVYMGTWIRSRSTTRDLQGCCRLVQAQMQESLDGTTTKRGTSRGRGNVPTHMRTRPAAWLVQTGLRTRTRGDGIIVYLGT